MSSPILFLYIIFNSSQSTVLPTKYYSAEEHLFATVNRYDTIGKHMVQQMLLLALGCVVRASNKIVMFQGPE